MAESVRVTLHSLAPAADAAPVGQLSLELDAALNTVVLLLERLSIATRLHREELVHSLLQETRLRLRSDDEA